MGPRSREAIANAIGFVIDELQLQREASKKFHEDVRTLLAAKLEQLERDNKKADERIRSLELALRRGGGAPQPT